MKLNKLGNSDLSLSQIGMGTWAIGGGDWGMGWGDQDERESIQAIIEAFEQGINWVDTAHAYGFGVSEEAVGKALCEWKADEIIYLDITRDDKYNLYSGQSVIGSTSSNINSKHNSLR